MPFTNTGYTLQTPYLSEAFSVKSQAAPCIPGSDARHSACSNTKATSIVLSIDLSQNAQHPMDILLSWGHPNPEEAVLPRSNSQVG